MTKKSNRWIDEYDDEYYTDKRNKKKGMDRRKKKKMKTALKTKNLDDLMNMDDDY